MWNYEMGVYRYVNVFEAYYFLEMFDNLNVVSIEIILLSYPFKGREQTLSFIKLVCKRHWKNELLF